MMKRRPLLTSHAFTLAELLVVVIVLGIISGLAIPSFRKTLENGYENDAITQLKTLHGANMAYRARSRAYWPPNSSSQNVAAINSNLKLNLIENQMTYSCTGSNGSTFTCTATRSGNNSYTVRVTEANLAGNNVNPCSTRDGATCP